MKSKQLIQQRLRYTLVASGLAFLLAGSIIQTLWSPPRFTLLIERSYCPPREWQTLATAYDQLYKQHQRKQIQLERVILFSSLGEEILPAIPSVQTIQALTTYGVTDHPRQATLQQTYPSSQLLSCNQPLRNTSIGPN